MLRYLLHILLALSFALPAQAADNDYIGRAAQNAQFGDRVVAPRTADMMEAFHYGLNTYSLAAPTKTGTGDATVTSSLLTLTTGASTGTARVETKRNLRYQAGFDGYAFFTAAFSASAANTYQRIGLFDENNGYWLGQEGGSFYIARRNATTDYKTTVNFTTAGAHFDPTKINAFRINYGWLGVLPIVFEYWDAGPRAWRELGAISVADLGVAPSVLQPNQPIAAEVGRTSGSGAVTLATASWSAGRIEQDQNHLPSDREFPANNTKTGITTEVNLLTIKSATTFQGLENHVVVSLDFLSMATEGTKPVTFYVKRNATLGGSPSYTARDSTNSVMSFDVAGTTVTGGTTEYVFQLGKAESRQMQNLALIIYPGDTITVSASTPNAADVGVAMRWRELF